MAGWIFLSSDDGLGTTGQGVLAALGMGVGVMVLIGLLACTAPTVRALRIDPTEALRAD